MSDRNDKVTGNNVSPTPELDRGIEELNISIKFVVIVGIIAAVIAVILLFTSGIIRIVPTDKISGLISAPFS